MGELFFSLNRVLTVFGLSWHLKRSWNVRKPSYVPVTKRMLYVAASALPYHISGYTTRTHAVIRALIEAGADVHPLTRPGYPWDRKDRIEQPTGNETVVDSVEYAHVRYPSNLRPVLQYAVQAAKAIAEVASRKRVAAIHAASNHVNALPALLAARQLGIPFHYEMRGLWELTRVSRMPAYENTQGFKQGLELEGFVAKNADRVFVISDQLGKFAQERWGISAERMALLPNCVNPAHFSPTDPQGVEPNTIAYAGSLIAYEGLDTLIEAVATLAKQGIDVQVRIVGDGEAKADLEKLANRLGLSDRIQFHGKVAPQVAREIQSRCAFACIPRKPFKVCEIVPPIKLVEALAMGKPVIVPDLPVFRDEMGADPAGWFFTAGDSADLARVIGIALSDAEKLKLVGARAREYAITKRRWQDFVGKVLQP
jgi:glycosyltransferase involved in cell wall biosynthesis